MNQIRIGLRENKTAFAPGETIAGAVDWECAETPTSAEVRLCWFTQGKGTRDAEIVETVSLANPQATDLRQYSFTAPGDPYSFSGRLISLIWVVELMLEPGEQCESVEIVIAPHGQEVLLAPEDSKGPQENLKRV